MVAPKEANFVFIFLFELHILLETEKRGDAEFNASENFSPQSRVFRCFFSFHWGWLRRKKVKKEQRKKLRFLFFFLAWSVILKWIVIYWEKIKASLEKKFSYMSVFLGKNSKATFMGGKSCWQNSQKALRKLTV